MRQLNLSSPLQPGPKPKRHSALGAGILLLAVVAVMASGCSVLRAPQAVVTGVVPGKQAEGPAPLDLQVQIQRFSDNFDLLTTQALDDYARLAGTETAREEALRLKLRSVSLVTSIASGPKPNANLLELISVVTLSRVAVEHRWRNDPNPLVWEPWLGASRVLESNVWHLAASSLKPAFVDELRRAIDEWIVQNPSASITFFVGPQQFASLIVHKEKQVDRNSVFSLLDLDPTAGLDPAVREMTEMRLMAERAMFTAQRMPFLLRWQVELLALLIADQPQVRLALTNTTLFASSAERISRATESLSQTAAQLPDRLSTERKEILAVLDQQEGKLKELAAQVDGVMESGTKMSTSLNTTIVTFDALMKRFGVGEPTTNAPRDTNSPPFNILDYGQVADRVGAMAKEIDILVNSVNQSVPQLDRLSRQATGDAQKVVDRGFRLALVLIAVLLGGALVTGLVYRFFGEKMKRAGHAPQASML
jgi:hypothetical protein